MFSNINFLKNTYSNEKLILFGSSTHFLKNSKSLSVNNSFWQNRVTLGDLLYKRYMYTYNFVAFSAISGYKYHFIFGKKKLPVALENSLERIIPQNNYKQPDYLVMKPFNLQQNVESRFLGHQFQKINTNENFDALFLIKNVKPFKIKRY